jgi:hypothetical protein
MCTRGSSPGVKLLWRVADYSPLSSHEFKNVWSCTSSPSSVLTVFFNYVEEHLHHYPCSTYTGTWLCANLPYHVSGNRNIVTSVRQLPAMLGLPPQGGRYVTSQKPCPQQVSSIQRRYNAASYFGYLIQKATGTEPELPAFHSLWFFDSTLRINLF